MVPRRGNEFASDSYFPFWQHVLERLDLALFDRYLADNHITVQEGTTSVDDLMNVSSR